MADASIVETRGRRAALARLGRLAGASTAGLAWPAWARAARPDPASGSAVQPVAVAPGVYLAQGLPAMGSAANRNYISNASFVVTRDGVVVIDALGAPVLAEDLLAAIARVTALPVRYVVVTHYHADHIYGLQVFRDRGAQIIAHRAGQAYLQSDTAALRLAASREELAPWIDERTRLVAADRWLTAAETITVGGVDFRLLPLGPAHTPEDLAVYLPQRGVLFSGDIVFRNRVPFVGQADSARWITALEQLLALKPTLVVPGHGPASTAVAEDLALTRDYLLHLRRTMGEAARNLEPFDEAYARSDWSRFEHLPLFRAANRINAYNTYLLMEQTGAR